MRPVPGILAGTTSLAQTRMGSQSYQLITLEEKGCRDLRGEARSAARGQIAEVKTFPVSSFAKAGA